jgi:hypothetical protein
VHSQWLGMYHQVCCQWSINNVSVCNTRVMDLQQPVIPAVHKLDSGSFYK